MRASRLLAWVPVATAACGYGTFQTAKTVAPGHTTLAAGASYVSNRNDSVEGHGGLDALAAELGPLRLGLTDHLDVGASMYLGLGARVDAKYNLLPRRARLAIAPRLGVGAARQSSWSFLMAMSGLLASYDVAPWVTPYAGLTYADHWISPETAAKTTLPNTRMAARRGYGDGLLMPVAGVRLGSEDSASFHVEYTRYVPMQNDPGDQYAFIPSNVVVAGFAFCLAAPCR